jgi:lysyl-tRNA synthetase class 1
MELNTLERTAETLYVPYTPLNANECIERAIRLADIIEERMEDLEHILLKYESYEVVSDEINRTLDLLRNLSENDVYFKLRIGEVTTFLPRNQPLYAFSCFVVVPSLMASAVYFRIPHSMRAFFPEVLALLDIENEFPNIIVSTKQRMDFLIERSALRVDSVTKLSRPVTDVVIFTGTPAHAAELRQVFDKRILFITNGAGHNPLVVAADANIDDAIEAVTTLQFYNQGQDCAAPNAILIHHNIYREFIKRLHVAIKEMKIGEYIDRSCRIGPISDPNDLVRIQEFLCEHGTWLDLSTQGVIETRNAIVYPTIITKPLSRGGNYSEIFAPIIFAQDYIDDKELATYFETKQYADHAMYVTLYGSSPYIESLIDKEFDGRILHTKKTFLKNKHLHMPGVERGTEPYGGYGYGASTLSIDGKVIPMPTLPQRDICVYVAEPMMKRIADEEDINFHQYSDIHVKNVQKILRLHSQHLECDPAESSAYGPVYLDTDFLKDSIYRYSEIKEDAVLRLLSVPNASFAATLDILEKNKLTRLLALISKRDSMMPEDFKTELYAIPQISDAGEEDNKKNQQRFFGMVYQLLFGKESGPKLTIFLREANKETIIRLLDVV